MKLSAVGLANHFASFFMAALHLVSTLDEKLELRTSVLNSSSGNQFYAFLQDRNPDSNTIKNQPAHLVSLYCEAKQMKTRHALKCTRCSLYNNIQYIVRNKCTYFYRFV